MSHDSAAFEQQLSELVDGRLAADAEKRVREHLASCAECREQFEAMTAVREMLRATPAPAVPEGLLARIERAAEAELARPAGPTIWERWRAPLGGLAAAAAIALAVFAPWQSANRQDVCEVCPPTEPPLAGEQLAAEPSEEPVADTPALPETDGVQLADASLAADADAGEVGAEMAAATVTRVRRAERTSPSTAPATPEPEVMDEAAADATVAQPAPQPELAWAPTPDVPSAAASGPMLGEIERPTVIAAGARTTIDAASSLAPARPSEMEMEMAAGVVAAMILDQFVAEHMVQSSSTLLSVVTDTPTSELGPAIASDEDEAGSFGLCFTDAMRRALTESENQLP